MKLIALIILSVIVILKTAPVIEPCNFQTVKQDIPPTSFEQITLDGNTQNTYVTRFFHNKFGIFANESAMCYFKVLDPVFIFESTTLIGLVGIAAYIATSVKRKYWFLVAILLLVPFLPFFGINLTYLINIYKFFAIIGLVFLFKLK